MNYSGNVVAHCSPNNSDSSSLNYPVGKVEVFNYDSQNDIWVLKGQPIYPPSQFINTFYSMMAN